MGDVVNLNRARKSKARAADRARAEENRVRFGRTKAEKEAAALETERGLRALDAHRIAPGSDPAASKSDGDREP